MLIYIYLGSSLAAEYANLAMKSADATEIWNEIISTYALHCMKGRPLFEAWRAHFENTASEYVVNSVNICIIITKDRYPFHLCRSPEKYTKLIEMYEREFSIPLYDMEETYIELKVLCEKNSDKFVNINWSRIDETYNSAKANLQKMLPFEKQLDKLSAQSHQDRASTYQKYIAECKSFASVQIVQTLYERMVTDCCLNRE